MERHKREWLLFHFDWRGVERTLREAEACWMCGMMYEDLQKA